MTTLTRCLTGILLAGLLLALPAACDDDGEGGRPDGGAGTGGGFGFAGNIQPPAGGSGGNAGAPAQTGGAGGMAVAGAGGGGGAAGGGPAGTLPVGAICANTGNCSQQGGAAVCCLTDPVPSCKLEADCPAGEQYLSCSKAADCANYGGKICCEVQAMKFCTKRSACTGKEI